MKIFQKTPMSYSKPNNTIHFKLFAIALTITAFFNKVSAFAWTPSGTGFGASTALGNLIDMLIEISIGLGAVLLAYGLYEFILSFTSQGGAENKTKGIATALTGTVMLSIGGVITYIATGQ